MATWGQKKIKVNEYSDSPELYYQYNTTSDLYCFIETGIDDYTGQKYESQSLFSDDVGTAMMEAYICHIMAMESLTEEQFVDKYIKNNRYRNTI